MPFVAIFDCKPGSLTKKDLIRNFQEIYYTLKAVQYYNKAELSTQEKLSLSDLDFFHSNSFEKKIV